MPLVLQALREGDNTLYKTSPELKDTQVFVHFFARQKRFQKIEQWGQVGEY